MTAASALLGRRFQDNHRTHGPCRGTVRFQGTLTDDDHSAAALSGEWLGVEWDDATRGKHDGQHAGRRYFTCAPGRGSFIRAASVDWGRHMVAALREKYGPEEGEEEGKNSQIVDVPMEFGDTGIAVEFRGVRKTELKQCRFDLLREVGLAGSGISMVDDAVNNDDDSIAITCPNIVDLDLSDNLLHSWTGVAAACRQLPHLESLRLNRNRFVPVVDSKQLSVGAFVNLTALSLNGTHMSWSEVCAVAGSMPRLDQLHFAFNQLQSIHYGTSDDAAVFGALTLLSLEHNQLHDWLELARELTVRTPRLRVLNVQSCQFSSIQPSTGFLPQLTTLNLSRNPLQTWASVDALNSLNSLVDVRLRECTVLSADGLSEDLARIQCIARLSAITALNGSTILDKQRRDSELYYLQQCASLRAETPDREAEFYALHPRYLQLVQLYGEPKPVNSRDEGKLKSSLMAVVFVLEDGTEYEKKLPPRTTVRVLSGLVQKMFAKRVAVPVQLYLDQVSSQTGQQMRIDMDDPMRDLAFYHDDATDGDGDGSMRVHVRGR